MVTDLEGLLDVTVVPNFAQLGKRLRGKPCRASRTCSPAADGGDVQPRWRPTATTRSTSTANQSCSKSTTSRCARPRTRSLVVVQDGAVAVALDTTLDDDLRLEGTARELVRAINDHRKAIGLDLADRIRVELAAPAPCSAARRHGEWIAGEVLAVEFGRRTAPAPTARRSRSTV